MNPLQKTRDEYKAALYKIAEYESPSLVEFQSVLDELDLDVAKKVLATTEKKWLELTSEEIKLLVEYESDDDADELNDAKTIELNESIWENQAKNIEKEAQATIEVCNYIPIVRRVALPLLRVFYLIIQRAAVDECKDEEIKFHLTASEVYEALTDLDDIIANVLIRKIDVKFPYTTERLLASYSKKDKDTFCAIINEENCDVSEINKYFSMEMIHQTAKLKKMTTFMDNEEFDDEKIEEYSKEAEDFIQDLIYEEEASGKESDLRKLDFHSLAHPDFSTRESFDKWLIQLANSCRLTCDSLTDFFDFLLELISEHSITRDEQCVLESIMTRPEGIALYNERKAVFEKKKEEALIDDQPQPAERLQLTDGKPKKAPAFEEIKEFVLPDNLMILPTTRQFNDYFTGFKLDLSQLKDIIEYLVKKSYISNLDRNILAFRLTGRMEIKPKELYPIQWTCQKKPGSSKELYYMLLCIDDDEKYSKVKEFFTGVDWPDAKRQKDMAREANSLFKLYFHNNIDGSVYKLYRTKG